MFFMNVDKNSIDRILSLDDSELGRLASEIASAAGADRLKTGIMLNNLDRLRAMISQMTPEEAQRLIDSAGSEKSGEIARILRERGVDIGR